MVAVSAAAEVVGVPALSSVAVGGTAARTRRLTVSRRTACRWEEASTAIVAAVGRGATHVPDAATGGAGGGVCVLCVVVVVVGQAGMGDVLWRVGRLKWWIEAKAQIRLRRGTSSMGWVSWW